MHNLNNFCSLRSSFLDTNCGLAARLRFVKYILDTLYCKHSTYVDTCKVCKFKKDLLREIFINLFPMVGP